MNGFRRVVAAVIVVSMVPCGGLVRRAGAAIPSMPTTIVPVSQAVPVASVADARRAIERAGVGRWVGVTLTREIVRGQIREITPDHFVLLRDSGAGSVELGYAEVQAVESHLSARKKVLIIIGLAALAAMVTVAVTEYRRLKK